MLLLTLVVVQPRPLVRTITGWPPPGWRMVMCDVGQGDALVLAAGEGAGVVVDAGPDPESVDRCLRSLGVTRVPLVVLTHFHADHVAGLSGVLRGREVGGIGTTGLEEPSDQAAAVRRAAAAAGVPVVRVVAGERRRAGDLSWEVLWPPPGSHPVVEGPNDASVAMLVRTGGLRLLLLGDLEPPAQRALARSPAARQLAGVDVLKVAHHGSAYQDPGLVRLAAPRLALISTGEDNTYGHPAPATVDALRAGERRCCGPTGTGRWRSFPGRAGTGSWRWRDTETMTDGTDTATTDAYLRRLGWSGPPGPHRTRCANCICAICGACRSRTCPCISARRSCWTRSGCWTRW